MCTGCGADWASGQKVVDVQGHFDRIHGGQKIKLELRWVGKGPAPIPPPEVKV